MHARVNVDEHLRDRRQLAQTQRERGGWWWCVCGGGTVCIVVLLVFTNVPTRNAHKLAVDGYSIKSFCQRPM